MLTSYGVANRRLDGSFGHRCNVSPVQRDVCLLPSALLNRKIESHFLLPTTLQSTSVQVFPTAILSYSIMEPKNTVV